MQKNMGTVQRVIWILLGLALIAWAIWGGGNYSWIGWIGVVPLLTGLVGWCAINAVLGINTAEKEHKSA